MRTDGSQCMLWVSYLLVTCCLALKPAFAGGEIHGTVVTIRGAEHSGSIRWDRNENFWDDFLDSSKAERILLSSRPDSVAVLGIKLVQFDDRDWVRPVLTVPFGHVERIQRKFRRDAIVTLKNGDVLRLRRPTGDLGGGVRGLVVDEEDQRHEIAWEEVREVVFSGSSASKRDSQRLYGVVETSEGDFEGYVVWDRDESLLEDVLEGEHDFEKQEIPFREIASLRRVDDESCEVELHDGTTYVLSGSNDVNSDIRGIDVTVDGIGRIQLKWEQFREWRLQPAPSSRGYGDYDGGYRLMGTVQTTDGRELEGAVIWDKDERHSWECLDGDIDGIDHAVLFEHIASIRSQGDASMVTLYDGRELRLAGSNDVNSSNKGIIVIDDAGQDTEVRWAEFERCDFRRP